MKDPLYWMPIKYKLTLTFILLSLVSLGIGGLVGYHTAKSALRDEIMKSVVMAMRGRLDGVAAYVDLFMKRTEDFSSDGFIRDAARGLQTSDSERLREKLNTHLRENKLAIVPDFLETLVVGRNGRVVASSSPASVGEDFSGRPGFESGRLGVHAEPLPGLEQEKTGAVLEILAPLTDRENRTFVGVIVNRVKPDGLSKLLSGEYPLLKSGGGAVVPASGGPDFHLVDGYGAVVESSRADLRAGERDNRGLEVPSGNEAGEFGSGLRAGYGGAEVISAWGRVPGTDWTLVSEVETKAAFRPVAVLRNRIIMVGVLLAVVTMIVLFFPSKFMIGPIMRLRDAARRIAEGDFNVRVGVHSKDEIGQLAGAFNQMAVDLQERARMEERLLHHEKMTAIGEISASLAHEMNTPLASVVMYSQMLREECPKGAPPCGHVDVILRNARACESTMRSLLNYARRTQTVKKTFDLNDCVQEAVGLCRPLLERSRIRLDLGLESGLPEYVGDQERMRQVFVNLAMNAIQAMESGGTLSIRSSYAATDGLYPEPVGNVTKTLHRPAEGAASSQDGSGPETPAARRTRAETGEGANGAGHIRLEFRDTGKGIPPEYSDRIFDSFFTTKPEGVGTGLGLSIARRIVEEHGGTIELADSSGEGARFLVTLPMESGGGPHEGGQTRPSVNEVHDSA